MQTVISVQIFCQFDNICQRKFMIGIYISNRNLFQIRFVTVYQEFFSKKQVIDVDNAVTVHIAGTGTVSGSLNQFPL